jgi:hypothetical protein
MIEKMAADLLARMDADKEERKREQGKMAGDLLAKMAADKEDFLARMDKMNAKMADRQEQILAEINAKMDETIQSIRSEVQETSDNRKEWQRVYNQKTAMHSLKDDQNEKTSDKEATEKIEKNPGMMQSAEEHQDVHNEDVAVMPVKGLKKRRRGRKSTAGRHGKPKKRNRGNCGTRNKLAAACRKVSRYATVAWRKRKLFRKSETRGFCGSRKGVTVADRRTSGNATVTELKRNLFRRSGTQEFCGQRRELTAAGIRKMPCVQVVRRKRRSDEGLSVEQGTRNNKTRNKFARRTRKGRKLGRGQEMRQEGTNALRN